MRIGILTFHRSINDGAVMQCYSLSKRLTDEFPNADVEVIDYHMPRVQQHYNVSLRKQLFPGSITGSVKAILKFLCQPTLLKQIAERNRTFECCINQLPLSQKKILDNGSDELFTYINNYYDIVIAGSDAIWNYNLRGYPNPYYLSDKVSIPMLSYAASCYGMIYERIPQDQKNEIAHTLNCYSFLGVRDDETAQFARCIGVTVPTVHTCDPTVFLDTEHLPISVSDLERKMKDRGFDFSKPAIGVMSGNKMCRMVRRMYGRQYQIVGLQSPSIYADVNLHDLSPYEWSYVFRYFKLTFTTFFHGTLVSLRNGIPVIAIALDSEYAQTHTTKVQDFLRRINMESCYFKTDYSRKYDTEIRKKADELLNATMQKTILKQMETEAKYANVFFEHIHRLITQKEETR